MRPELLWNMPLLIERLALEFQRRGRLSKIKGTVARDLKLGHLGTLELIKLTGSHTPQVVYDIGAYTGTWALLAKACLPNAAIHAFEPLAIHAAQFREETKNVRDITLHEIGMGAGMGKAHMYVTNRTDSSSLLKPTKYAASQFSVFEEKKETISVVSLDQYVSGNKLPLPDLIKLDVQGYELEVLSAGQTCLGHADWVICEVSFTEYYQGQPLFHDVIDFMHRNGLELYALGHDTPLGEKLTQIDILFKRRP
jgi:FkbM family methyltransferase